MLPMTPPRIPPTNPPTPMAMTVACRSTWPETPRSLSSPMVRLEFKTTRLARLAANTHSITRIGDDNRTLTSVTNFRFAASLLTVRYKSLLVTDRKLWACATRCTCSTTRARLVFDSSRSQPPTSRARSTLTRWSSSGVKVSCALSPSSSLPASSTDFNAVVSRVTSVEKSLNGTTRIRPSCPTNVVEPTSRMTHWMMSRRST